MIQCVIFILLRTFIWFILLYSCSRPWKPGVESADSSGQGIPGREYCTICSSSIAIGCGITARFEEIKVGKYVVAPENYTTNTVR